jgi:hypothetical protein
MRPCDSLVCVRRGASPRSDSRAAGGSGPRRRGQTFVLLRQPPFRGPATPEPAPRSVVTRGSPSAIANDGRAGCRRRQVLHPIRPDCDSTGQEVRGVATADGARRAPASGASRLHPAPHGPPPAKRLRQRAENPTFGSLLPPSPSFAAGHPKGRSATEEARLAAPRRLSEQKEAWIPRRRVKDVAFERRQLTVRDPKWKHDRVTMLPAATVAEIHEQLTHAHVMRVLRHHGKRTMTRLDRRSFRERTPRSLA